MPHGLIATNDVSDWGVWEIVSKQNSYMGMHFIFSLIFRRGWVEVGLQVWCPQTNSRKFSRIFQAGWYFCYNAQKVELVMLAFCFLALALSGEVKEPSTTEKESIPTPSEAQGPEAKQSLSETGLNTAKEALARKDVGNTTKLNVTDNRKVIAQVADKVSSDSEQTESSDRETSTQKKAMKGSEDKEIKKDDEEKKTKKTDEEEEKKTKKADDEEEKKTKKADDEEEKKTKKADEEEEKKTKKTDEEEEKKTKKADEEEEKKTKKADEEEEKKTKKTDDEEEKKTKKADEEEEKKTKKADDEEEKKTKKDEEAGKKEKEVEDKDEKKGDSDVKQEIAVQSQRSSITLTLGTMFVGGIIGGAVYYVKKMKGSKTENAQADEPLLETEEFY